MNKRLRKVGGERRRGKNFKGRNSLPVMVFLSITDVISCLNLIAEKTSWLSETECRRR